MDKKTLETEMRLLAYKYGRKGGHTDLCPDGFSSIIGTGKYSPKYRDVSRFYMRRRDGVGEYLYLSLDTHSIWMTSNKETVPVIDHM